ncbi:MAG: T9SS type A sorting domain-containing protein [Saprospiraceae bacterium]|nr:T9SS type A sorting domain-containing protein [Saprospiraceae bacterium]
MKNFSLLLILLLSLLKVGKTTAQTLVCNDLVMVSLDQNCTHTLTPDQILEGTILDNCIVELDRVAPFGNGPWTSPDLGPADVNKTYMVRVKHVPSGTSCWGNLTVEDKLPPTLDCTQLTTVDITGGGPATLFASDLAVTASDACMVTGNPVLSFAGNQNSKTFDCIDLGAQLITVVATDASNNTASCQATVLVTNSDGSCLVCLDACPAAQVITFEEGYNTLLPAFEGGNFGAFDVYGNAVFDDAGCSFVDSTYQVTYTPNVAGQSWFTREWLWNDGAGQQVAVCRQRLIFTTNRTVMIEGFVYLDEVENCTRDVAETPIPLYPINIVKLPSGDQQQLMVASDGYYSGTIQFNILDSVAEVRLQLPSGVVSVCPNTFVIPYGTATLQNTFDFGVQSAGNCPLMEAQINALATRRCFNNTYKLKYCNVGLDTAYDAHLSLVLDDLMNITGSSWPYNLQPDDSYRFDVGDVPPFTCKTITLTIGVDCAAQLGQTLCVGVTAFPNEPCNGNWLGAELEASAVCEGDSVALTIRNRGVGDMGQAQDFIVIEDFIMFQSAGFKLNADETVTTKVPVNGSTWRIETSQIPNHPSQNIVAAAVEGCDGVINTPGAITAFSLSDPGGFYDEECNVVTGSYDPNDKTALPTGLGADHIIRANDWIDYKIRFQNTGTDTAFNVVIVDTLPAQVNPFTLEAGASSHFYRLDILEGGILKFVFDRIMLPDSNHNEPESHGFVQFRVAQQPNLPNGTTIDNTAAIYFDFNDPIFTNTVRRTIGQPYLVLDEQTPFVPGVTVQAIPNPFAEKTTLTIEGITLNNAQLTLFDNQGKLVRNAPMNGNQIVIERQSLTPGMYFFQITHNGKVVCSGKLNAN